ncbi:MAG: hypothetical protein ACK41Q_04300 [Candidatus Brocadia sp.]
MNGKFKIFTPSVDTITGFPKEYFSGNAEFGFALCHPDDLDSMKVVVEDVMTD